MIRHEIRRFMTDIGIHNATWQERLDKAQEEVYEWIEVAIDPAATLDEKLSELADIGIVGSTMVEKSREEAAQLGANLDALMVCKMDEVRRRENGPRKKTTP